MSLSYDNIGEFIHRAVMVSLVDKRNRRVYYVVGDASTQQVEERMVGVLISFRVHSRHMDIIDWRLIHWLGHPGWGDVVVARVFVSRASGGGFEFVVVHSCVRGHGNVE